MVRVTSFVTGRVQGVGFRFTTLEVAKSYSVVGTVENLTDGRVKIVAEGEANEVDDFLKEVANRMRDFIHHMERFSSEPSRTFQQFQIVR
jgi:acylphosphatase